LSILKPGHPANVHLTGECGITDAHSLEDHAPLNIKLKDPVYINRRVSRDPGCAYCKELLAEGTDFAPPHEASQRCQSGKRNHCSCDTCF
jgi:hypothetical protein